MKIARLVGLLLVAVLAMSLTTAAVASAASDPEFKTVFPNPITSGLSLLSILKTPANSVHCEKDRFGGAITSIDLLGNVVVHFLECTSTGAGGSNCPISSTGIPNAQGLILTNTLHGLLGLILPKPAVGSNVGLLFLPGSGVTFTTLNANACTEETRVTGNVAGDVEPIGKKTKELITTFEVFGGAQQITDIDVLGVLIKPKLVAFTETATFDSIESATFEKELEIS